LLLLVLVVQGAGEFVGRVGRRGVLALFPPGVISLQPVLDRLLE
jgi:hypothetical protein